ncbi:BTAD domain-containing putative transcriptional regulator [Streptomyces sp. NPDC058855]|uniref:AfsR/SARP family transcriptional regulator n=1 Tax=Streptomyces sp. NPDC058855 TaxID=3346651 RepID=UPI0036C0CBF8
MRFGVLGSLTVRTAEGTPVPVTETKVRTLLAHLLVHAGRPAPAHRLIDGLWGTEPPRNPANALQNKISRLRHILGTAAPGGRGRLALRPDGYVLDVDPDQLDATRFRALAAHARTSPAPGERAALLTGALALWRGPAYAGLADHPVLRAAADALEEERLAALEDLAETRLALGEHEALAAELAEPVARHPLRERLRAAHLRALYGTGRRHEALRSYGDLRDRLAEELGLDPGPALTALHEAILRDAPDPHAPPPHEAAGTAPVLGAAGTAPAPEASGTAPPHEAAGTARPPASHVSAPALSSYGPAAHAGTPPARAATGTRTGPAAGAAEGTGTPPAPAPYGRPAPDTLPPGHPRTNLPAQHTELIGRAAALADLHTALTAHRLVTLTGPGGVGKTRLALEAATRAAPAFPDGTWLVELAALDTTTTPAADPVAALAEALTTALGIRDDTLTGPTTLHCLTETLRDRTLLLVLDNCEHLTAPVAHLAAHLLRTAPAVRLLATSQEPLGVPGEQVRAVPPLDLPPPAPSAEGPDPDTLLRSGAVRLFVARATAAVQDFTLTADNAGAVAAICRRLDGIPLALELAATRLKVLGPQGLLDRLDDRFRLLTAGPRTAPARQQTLRAVIDWSWELLTASEQIVLRRLAVHADGCTLDAAETVCAGDGVKREDVLDLLARLVDRSLVVTADTPAGVRYRLLESVAAYCHERLHEAGEHTALTRRHRAHYTALAERARPHLRGPDQRAWLTRLDQETANLRKAAEHPDPERPDAGDPTPLLRLADALAWYWILRGRLREARRTLRTALTTAPPGAPPALVASATAWWTAVALLQGDGDGRATRLATALDLTAALDDPHALAHTRWLLGFALLPTGDLRTSESLTGLALDGFTALDDPWGTAAALAVSATHALVRGDLPALRTAGERSARTFTELGDRWGRLQTVHPLASLAESTGDHDTALRLHEEGLRIAEELGLWTEASHRLSGLGRIALLRGDHARSRALHERAVRLSADHSDRPGVAHAEIGLALTARRAGDLAEAETHLRSVLAWSERVDFATGRALVLAELGFVAELRGDADTARAHHLAGLAAARETGDPRALALALEGLAGAHALAGDPTRAARLLGAAHAARVSVGAPLPPAERGDVDRVTATLRAALGDAALATAFAEGTGLGPAEAAVQEAGAAP